MIDWGISILFSSPPYLSKLSPWGTYHIL